jgi:hypothetical protein
MNLLSRTGYCYYLKPIPLWEPRPARDEPSFAHGVLLLPKACPRGSRALRAMDRRNQRSPSDWLKVLTMGLVRYWKTVR